MILSREEVLYLLMILKLTPDLRLVLEAISAEGGELNEDQADELRDLCNEKLDICGYDENYKLNENGKKLEALVDKLFIG
ncbi:hypothetical protein [Gayadomonas joobiniege]|uniref:hypothetical protein n=1 Tax=Gayadomonas joobiniege TaxID=1234606 RepID=UPI00036508F9|nr:hypothetical protein [Gayadomonas joobiniege]